MELHNDTFHQNFNEEHKCEICEKVFNAKRKLEKHLIAVHGNSEKVFICNVCTKTFQR